MRCVCDWCGLRTNARTNSNPQYLTWINTIVSGIRNCGDFGFVILQRCINYTLWVNAIIGFLYVYLIRKSIFDTTTMNKSWVKQCYIVFITDVNTELRNFEEIENTCRKIQTADDNNTSQFLFVLFHNQSWCCPYEMYPYWSAVQCQPPNRRTQLATASHPRRVGDSLGGSMSVHSINISSR